MLLLQSLAGRRRRCLWFRRRCDDTSIAFGRVDFLHRLHASASVSMRRRPEIGSVKQQTHKIDGTEDNPKSEKSGLNSLARLERRTGARRIGKMKKREYEFHLLRILYQTKCKLKRATYSSFYALNKYYYVRDFPSPPNAIVPLRLQEKLRTLRMRSILNWKISDPAVEWKSSDSTGKNGEQSSGSLFVRCTRRNRSSGFKRSFFFRSLFCSLCELLNLGLLKETPNSFRRSTTPFKSRTEKRLGK